MAHPTTSPLSNLPLVIVLAAGRGERFTASGGGPDKLRALLSGRPVIDHVLGAVAASGLRHHVVERDPSRPGMGDSIAAGVRATAGAPGWLVLPADLPLVTAATLRAVALATMTPGCDVLVPRFKSQGGHPVRFSSACGEQLGALSGPRGAAAIVKHHAQAGRGAFIDLDDAGIVTDVDTLEDLERAQRLLDLRTL
ncbi:MAG: nucleotidyltransferase family protein [Comamonadaceae bacterium]|nr:MAG: nucleotidyltransferase family protein [Comamonadaceae bacterium]